MPLTPLPRRPGGRWIAAALVLVGALALAACSSPDRKVSSAGVPTTLDIAANPNGGTFSVLSYNVAGLPAEISQSRPDLNLPLISPLLDDDDIVLTQEDYDWWVPHGLASKYDFVNYHERLRSAATHAYQSPPHPGPKAVKANRPDLEIGDGLGTLSRFPGRHDTRVPWAGCFGGWNQDDGGKADCLAMKGFQVTTVELPNGAEVLVYNINAEAGTNPKDQALQAADFDQLAEHIARHAKGQAVILGGDTNLFPADEELASDHGADGRIWKAFLAATGLTDACAATDCDEPGVVDRVAFRSGDGVDLGAATYELRTDTFVDDDGEPLSDNPPVQVLFEWKPA